MATVNSANATNVDHNLIVGSGSIYNSIEPSSTSGIPLVSQGASADPEFSTMSVSGGGTGIESATAYTVLCGGTDSTAPLQPLSSVGNTNTFLISNGNGQLPSFSTPANLAFSSIVIRTFTTSVTYTPTDGMAYCIAELVGGGGGGGGSDDSINSHPGGGGGGGYTRKVITAATIGASQSINIGRAGTGGADGSTNGTAGGTTSLGSICNATGGIGGTAASGGTTQGGGAGGIGNLGDLNIVGQPGQSGQEYNLGFGGGGAGGSSPFGFGFGGQVSGTTTGTGTEASGYGGGGSGNSGQSGGSSSGGNGTKGVLVITEFIA